MYEGEKKLWQEVIIMAISDTMNKRLGIKNRKAALNWLCKDNIGFSIVCDLAGVHPEAVRRGFRKLKKKLK
jgi:hypothetical protein